MELLVARTRRMAQLEDELAGQQRQLDTFRKTLANVVDVATHRMHKETVASKLANKADLGMLERQYVDMIEVHHKELSEALTTKADADAIKQCQREFLNCSEAGAALEDQHERLLEKLEENGNRLTDLRSRHDRLMHFSQGEVEALELHQKVLEAALAEKADIRALAEQERRISRTESFALELERTQAQAAQEQLSVTLSAEMNSQVLCQVGEDAIKVQRQRLDATKAELTKLEHVVGELQSAQVHVKEEVIARQEQWYKEKDHEQYLLAVARKERQDHQLVQALAKKADVVWYEQQTAIIEATQLSLTRLNGGQKDVQMQLMDKVDTFTLEKFQKRLQQDIAKAREETAEVAKRVDKHSEQLDMARGQLLEMNRQWREVEAMASMKADKAALDLRDEQFASLQKSMTAMEERQEASERKLGRVQEQLYYSGRQPSNAGVNGAHAMDYMCSSGEQCTKRPPPSPREHRPAPRRPITPGHESPYKCKPKFHGN